MLPKVIPPKPDGNLLAMLLARLNHKQRLQLNAANIS